MHTDFELGCWRMWVGRWNVEIACPTTWSGIRLSGNSDPESGRSFAVAIWPFVLYVGSGIPTLRVSEYCFAFYSTADHLCLSWYRGNDEMNHMPWMFEWPWRRWHHVRHEILSEPEQAPYHYRLRSGEVQNVTATIQVEEREWRWFWKRSPIRRVSRYIDVRFDGEVGEGAGSWKGGTIGCGYDLKPDETPLQCLRRMERERYFL